MYGFWRQILLFEDMQNIGISQTLSEAMKITLYPLFDFNNSDSTDFQILEFSQTGSISETSKWMDSNLDFVCQCHSILANCQKMESCEEEIEEW